MDVVLPRTDLALEICRSHIVVAGFADPPLDTNVIEAYLARHLVIQLCAEVEETIGRLVDTRIAASGCDEEALRYIRSRGGSAVRNARSSEIADMLGQLSASLRKRYLDSVAASVGDAGAALLGNVVTARNSIAHGSPASMSLREVAEAVEVASAIVIAARDALES